MAKVLLADDHEVVRQGMRRLLESEKGFTVVGETGDGLEVLDLTMQLMPDVLVLDLAMPGLGGLDITQRVKRQIPATRIVILSIHSNEAYVLQALRNGATGYVTKDSSGTELVQSVRNAALGRRYLSAPLSDLLIESYVKKSASLETDPYDALTKRERDVLHLLAEGMQNVEVAARLSISRRTVESHRDHVMRKLRLKSKSDLIRYAIKKGIAVVEE